MAKLFKFLVKAALASDLAIRNQWCSRVQKSLFCPFNRYK